MENLISAIAKLNRVASAMRFENIDEFNADKRFCECLIDEMKNLFSALTDEQHKIIDSTYYFTLGFYDSIVK